MGGKSRRSWDSRRREQGWGATEPEIVGPVWFETPGGDDMSESSWIGGNGSSSEVWEAEWVPLPSPCPPYMDSQFCHVQPEEMMMMVSLHPNFPGQDPLLAPDGQLVYPVQYFSVRWGPPESCSYLGPVDLPLGEMEGGGWENEDARQNRFRAKGCRINRTQETGSCPGPKGRETWGKKERRPVGHKEEEIPRREPRTLGKWISASKREKRVSKKRRSGMSNGPSTEEVKKPTFQKRSEVENVTETRRDDDVAGEDDIETLQKELVSDTPTLEEQIGESGNIELLADKLKPLKLDWNDLE